VAYVRFASVYRDFREAADFHEVLAEIAGKAGAAPSETGASSAAALVAGGKL
jgi:transcriptional repressor NrdR